MGYTFEVMRADIDESAIRHPDPEALVTALGHAKADAILRRLPRDDAAAGSSGAPELLITGDQVVVHRGEILEKPTSAADARRILYSYGSAPAITVGSVVVTDVRSGERFAGVDRAEVYFRAIPPEVIDRLIEQGEVYGSAGGLMVEHPLVSPFVDHMVGTLDSVMGLSKQLTRLLIERALERAERAN